MAKIVQSEYERAFKRASREDYKLVMEALGIDRRVMLVPDPPGWTPPPSGTNIQIDMQGPEPEQQPV